ncbi:hypothetical protein I4U23_013499 [Adineta vaga]|nr:hypothetical protein I4U23_013499 [Adineta vaga]
MLSLRTGTECIEGEKLERNAQVCFLHGSHNEFDLNKYLRLYLFVSCPPYGLDVYLSDTIKQTKFEDKSLNSYDEEEHHYLKLDKRLQQLFNNQISISLIELSGLIIQTNMYLTFLFQYISIISVKNRLAYNRYPSEQIKSTISTIFYSSPKVLSSSALRD